MSKTYVDWKTRENGTKYDFSIMFLESYHIKCIYGSLIKERSLMFPLVEHFNETENEGTQKFREEITKQFETLTELINKLKPVVECIKQV